MKNVCTRWWNMNVYKVGTGGGGRGGVGHAFKEEADLVGGEGEAAAGVYVGY